MGLFDETAKYNGCYTRSFNHDDFWERASASGGRYHYSAAGACAALCADWLDFKVNHHGFPYPPARLENNLVIHNILETQMYLRIRDISLAEFISNYGIERKISTREDTPVDTLLSQDINVISYKYTNPDGTNGNHVAVAIGYIHEGKFTFELFDSMRGDVKFSFSSLDDRSGAQAWLTRYLDSYASKGVEIQITPFSSRWVNSYSRVAAICERTNDTFIQCQNSGEESEPLQTKTQTMPLLT